MKVMIEVQDLHEYQAVEQMLSERRRQDRLFGQQNHDPAWWMVILGEEFGEMSQAVCDSRWKDVNTGLRDAVREAEQVAAVAIAFIQCMKRGKWADEITTAKPTDKRQLAVAANKEIEEMVNYDQDGEV